MEDKENQLGENSLDGAGTKEDNNNCTNDGQDTLQDGRRAKVCAEAKNWSPINGESTTTVAVTKTEDKDVKILAGDHEVINKNEEKTKGNNCPPINDESTVIKTENQDVINLTDDREVINKNEEETKSKNTTSDISDEEKDKMRMETYVMFVNNNWKRALTKLKNKDNKEENDLTNDASKDCELCVNEVNEEATEISENCTTPEGFLHTMWLESLVKGEVVIGKNEKRKSRKKSLSPYMVFCKEKEKELSHLTWKEFFGVTKKAWKGLGEQEREKFKLKCQEMREKNREKIRKVSGTETVAIKDVKIAGKLVKKPRSAFSIYMASLSPEASKLEAMTRWNGLGRQVQKEFMEMEKEEFACYKLDIREDRRNLLKGGNRRRKRRNQMKHYDATVNDIGERVHVGRQWGEGGEVINRPPSAFEIFMNEAFKNVLSTEGMDTAEIKAQANNQWRKLGKEEREVFKAKAHVEWNQHKKSNKIVGSGGEYGSVSAANVPRAGGNGIPISESGESFCQLDHIL